MHRVHRELTLRAAQQAEANLLIHPAVGSIKPGDVDYCSRVRCYEHLLRTYPEQTTTLSLLNLAMRMAGPREALWHAIIRQNYGCTHFIVGHNHAGPDPDAFGRAFYEPYAAQELIARYQSELGIQILPFPEMVYVRERAQYIPASEILAGEATLSVSGTEFRRRLQEGLEIPEWFSDPEVVAELRRAHPSRNYAALTRLAIGKGSRCSSPACPAPANRRSPTHSWSSCWNRAAARSPYWTAILFASTCPANWASHGNIATSTFCGSVSSPARSPRTAALPSVRRSRPTQPPAAKSEK